MTQSKNATQKNASQTAIAKNTVPAITEKATPETVKPAEVVQTTETPVKVLPTTAAERIKASQQFNIISDKYERLVEKRDNLKKFILSNDGTKEKITLSNAAGQLFEVSNTHTIARVLTVINDDLDVVVATAEKQILEFAI
ncbi:hypothetical protein ACLI1A_10140 [Flavobacterium sp. RHBU_3]|uniref:hypothetical protein n=1 Tax=Flavobacterium sp. RHBU_3 TaxID=3391184 RepID=UPI0039847EF1